MKDFAPSAWLSTRDGHVVIGYGPFNELTTPPENGVAFYVQRFDLQDLRPWKIPKSYEVISADDFRERYSSPESCNVQWQELNPTPFFNIFQEINAHILSGSFEKTVPVVTEIGRTTDFSSRTICSRLAQIQPPLYSYGWIEPKRGFAGASPELLFSLEGKQCKTMALAGTAHYQDRAIFAVDEKEIREHQYVAQTLISKLQDLGEVTCRPRQILHLQSIVHFLTEIDVKLDHEHCPNSIIKQLHPTPALGPLPRTADTQQLLHDWRSALNCPEEFGAPFGLWRNGIFEAIVAIRGLWWNDDTVLLPAGCGIIEASRLLNEWRELSLKRNTVKQFLGLG